MRIVAIAIVAVVVGGAGRAVAAPTVTIERPTDGSTTTNPTPSFGGLAEEAAGEVTLTIHSGTNVAGTLVQTLTTLAPPLGGAWELAAGHLADGTYTAQAAQKNLASEVGVSPAVTFTVDTASPTVTLNRPASPSKDTTPSFTGSASESTTAVVVHIYNSSETEVASATAPGTGGAWDSSDASAPLSSGEYEAIATQASSLGNPEGKSTPVSFTVDTTPPAVSLTPVAPLTNNTEPSFSGSAGDAPGDIASVTLNIYSGEGVAGSPIRTIKVTPVGTTWSAVVAESLNEGTYTARAEQSDEAGNAGLSALSTFTIKTKGPAVSLSSVASPTNDPTPSFSGGAGVAPGDIASVTLKVYSGDAASGSPVRMMEVTPSGAAWKATLAETLSDGTYTAQAEQSDKAGNTAKSAPSTFTVDTTPPTVSLTPLAALTNDPTPSFSGTAGVAPGDITLVTLKIYSGENASGSPIRTIEVTPNGGTWSTGLSPPLNEGTYTAQAEQSDEAGNTTRSAPSTFTVDTTPPAVSLTPLAALMSNPEPSFGGNAGVAPGDVASVTLKVYSGEGTSGSLVRTVTVTPSGAAWKATLAEALNDGTYTAQAEQSDKAGNTTKSAPSIFTVDTTPPAVSLNPAASPTNNTTPVFSGNAGVAAGDDAALTLKLYSGSSASGSPIQTIAVTPTGATWKATVTTPLGEGTYTARVEQSDKAGNIGRSTASTFAIFTTPPPLSLNPVASPTNSKEPSFSGAAGDSSVDIPVVTLKIYSGSSVSGSPIRTLPPITPTGATWKASPSAAEALNDGTYTAQAEQSDKAGNTTKSTPSTFVVDTTPPAVSLTSVASLTNNPKPSFSGGAGVAPGDAAVVTLKIYSGGSASGTPARTVPVPTAGTTWTESLAEALGEGTYTVQAEQSDEAGNTGKSATSTFTVDTTPPAVTLNSIASFTKDPTPGFSGNAGAASGDIASVTLHVYSGAGVSGVPIRTVKVVPSGTSWSAGFTEALGEGTYTAEAEQFDQAGNSGRSTASTFTVKAKGPALTLSPVAAATNNPEPAFSGNAGAAVGDLPSVTLNIYVGESVSGNPIQTVTVTSTGVWQARPSGGLADGTYTVQAEQSDQAGNTTNSAQSTFEVDTTPPLVGITAPLNEAEVTKSQPTFSGVVGKARGDLPTVTLKIFTGTPPSGTPVQTLLLTPNGNGKWSTAASGPKLPDGSYTAQAEQSDVAGNTGVSTTKFTIKTHSPVVTLDTAEFAQRATTLFTGATPSFSGSASEAPEDSETVTLSIYGGTSASGSPLQTVEGSLSGEAWTAGPLAALTEGTYTVQAEQKDSGFKDPGVSAPVTFSVDDTPPAVSLSYPAKGSSTTGESQLLRGLAGTAEGDLPSVTVQLFSGSSVEGQLLQSIVVNGAGGAWSATLAGLSPGTYTARAEQSDDTGNVGMSSPTTFTIIGPGGAGAAAQAPTPPAASFSWFPSVPKPRETVSLASSSTDVSSPITAFAWDLTGSGAFVAGGQLISTSFATAGNHLVHLRVTGADGLSSVATETIPVLAPLIPLMQPFPVVRIASTDTASGIRLSLLRVLAPAGARIGVECKGLGCPARSESRIAAVRKVGVAPVEFRRFERPLRAGVVLEIRISKAGEIGKFTSFQVRRRRLPLRVDACLGPTGVKPIACPP